MQINVDDAETALNLQAVVDAVDAVILGSDARGVKAVDTVTDGGSAVPPANDLANRGQKWLFRSQDSTTQKIYQNEIGTADFTALPTPTSDFLDLTAGVGLALKNAWDTAYRSPVGNTGVLLSVQQITRTD